MSVKDITELVKSEYVFATLFILGLIFVGHWVVQTLRDQSIENREFEDKIISVYEKSIERAEVREGKLMKHQDNMTAQLKQMNHTQTQIQENLTRLERQTEDNFREIWKEINKNN